MKSLFFYFYLSTFIWNGFKIWDKEDEGRVWGGFERRLSGTETQGGEQILKEARLHHYPAVPFHRAEGTFLRQKHTQAPLMVGRNRSMKEHVNSVDLGSNLGSSWFEAALLNTKPNTKAKPMRGEGGGEQGSEGVRTWESLRIDCSGFKSPVWRPAT